MRTIPFFVLLLISSCGVKSKHNFSYGTISSSELVASKGEPIQKEEIPVPDSQMYVYPNNEKYQVKNDVVQYGLKDPVGDEKKVIYWEHKFKDCKTEKTILPRLPGLHTPSEIELACTSEGVSVIYESGSSYVKRVVEYEKK